jgi:hypothetical protein
VQLQTSAESLSEQVQMSRVSQGVLAISEREMKGVLTAMCKQLGIPCYQAPPEAHNSILCERFHRCLSKVEKTGAADAESHEQWAMNALFATCASNGSPADGTDVIRSFAAKARTFHFPLDIQNGDEVALIPEQGKATLQHAETMILSVP